jgi:phosphate/phosphite/phosphonate ABC transporter binding protein
MKKINLVFSILIFTSLVLGACAPQAAAPTAAPTATTAAVPTQPPEPTATPMAEPTQEAVMLPDLGGREITVAVENAYLPFNYVSLKTGQAEGWDYDFINEACKRLNCTPKWIEFQWDTMIASVANGQFDMAADGITITPERAQQVDFSEGYVNIQQRLMVRGDESRFTSIDELAADPSLLLAEQVGTTNYETAKKYVGDARIKSFDTFGLAVQALISGDVDGVVIDEVAGLGYLGANKDKVKLIGDSISSDQLGFIFPKGSDLVKPFNAVIDQMKADGSLDQINTKWFSKSTEELTQEAGGVGEGAYKKPDLGTPDNPIIVAFEPSATSQEITAGGQELLDLLSQETGLTFKGVIPTSYAALTEAMGSGNAQIGWMATFAYILAHQEGYADVALITNRFGSDHYGAQFIARADAGFTPAADVPATDEEISTLLQFKGKRPCYTDPQSTSGYVIPLIFLKKAGLDTDKDLKPAVYAQGHTQVVRAVYAGGICDFGATFVDARTSVTTDLPDVMDKVVVIYQTKALIPNDNMSYAPDLPQDLRDTITAAMLKIADTEEGKKALQDLYQIGGLVKTDDTVYDEFRSYLQASGVDLSQYVK